jgi:tetratricopeptide (TPR) repeat protein
MKGSLTDQPLAELIREIISKGLSGTLRIEHERAQAAVYFEDGQVVFAASNIRTLRLREYLIKRNLVSEKELENLGNLSDLGLARAFHAKGALKQEDMNTLLATMVRDTLCVALLWTEGSWDFNERAHLDDPVRVRLDTNSLLREAAHRLPLNFVSLRFRNPAEIVSRAADVSGTLQPGESFMLSRLDAPTNVEQLLAVSGLRELDAYRILYGLTLSGLVTREYWQNAFRTQATKSSKAQTSARIAPPPSKPESPAANSRWGAATEETELKPFFDRLSQAANYYQVLNLPTNAEATEIKDAYYALARLYHPDRFHLRSGTQLHAQLSSCFARITQAYETLTDPQARSTYDASLQRSRKFADSAPKPSEHSVPDPDELEFDGGSSTVGQAEHNFKEGFDALKQGRINAAAAHLAAASRLVPKDARYRAYYGRALAASEKTRRLAENEIQAAVTLDPGNATYRTMLAELYFDLKFHRRAQTELDRALALDPNNASAQSLSRKLGKN